MGVAPAAGRALMSGEGWRSMANARRERRLQQLPLRPTARTNLSVTSADQQGHRQQVSASSQAAGLMPQ